MHEGPSGANKAEQQAKALVGAEQTDPSAAQAKAKAKAKAKASSISLVCSARSTESPRARSEDVREHEEESDASHVLSSQSSDRPSVHTSDSTPSLSSVGDADAGDDALDALYADLDDAVEEAMMEPPRQLYYLVLDSDESNRMRVEISRWLRLPRM